MTNKELNALTMAIVYIESVFDTQGVSAIGPNRKAEILDTLQGLIDRKLAVE